MKWYFIRIVSTASTLLMQMQLHHPAAPDQACHNLAFHTLYGGCYCYTCCVRRKVRQRYNIPVSLVSRWHPSLATKTTPENHSMPTTISVFSLHSSMAISCIPITSSLAIPYSGITCTENDISKDLGLPQMSVGCSKWRTFRTYVHITTKSLTVALTS